MIFKLKDLIDEIQDGITMTFEVDDNAADILWKILKNGEGGTLPIKIKIQIEE